MNIYVCYHWIAYEGNDEPKVAFLDKTDAMAYCEANDPTSPTDKEYEGWDWVEIDLLDNYVPEVKV